KGISQFERCDRDGRVIVKNSRWIMTAHRADAGSIDDLNGSQVSFAIVEEIPVRLIPTSLTIPTRSCCAPHIGQGRSDSASEEGGPARMGQNKLQQLIS